MKHQKQDKNQHDKHVIKPMINMIAKQMVRTQKK